MKLLNRLRELRNETSIEFNIEETSTQDLLEVESTTLEDILRLNLAEAHPRSFFINTKTDF